MSEDPVHGVAPASNNEQAYMEPNKDLNKELKEEVNRLFADLFKEIGNNRVQLANKVLGVQQEINKELAKSKVDANRQKEILNEISRTVKMAAQQLPLLRRNPVAKPVPPAPKAVEKPRPKPATKAATAPAPKKKKKS